MANPKIVPRVDINHYASLVCPAIVTVIESRINHAVPQCTCSGAGLPPRHIPAFLGRGTRRWRTEIAMRNASTSLHDLFPVSCPPTHTRTHFMQISAHIYPLRIGIFYIRNHMLMLEQIKIKIKNPTNQYDAVAIAHLMTAATWFVGPASNHKTYLELDLLSSHEVPIMSRIL